MSDERATVRTYFNEIDAEIDRGRLVSAGIVAVVAKDDCGGTEPQLAYTRGVKLQVKAADASRAQEVLGVPETAAEGAPAWTCPACGADVESGFDACWRCSRSRDG